jgi:hypothetical protein
MAPATAVAVRARVVEVHLDMWLTPELAGRLPCCIWFMLPVFPRIRVERGSAVRVTVGAITGADVLLDTSMHVIRKRDWSVDSV